MIVIDGIVFSLQKFGGISVYFEELIKHLHSNDLSHEVILYDNDSSVDFSSFSFIRKNRYRIFERYRSCEVSPRCKVFHSSYYRVPDRVVPLITTVHDFTYEKYFNYLSKCIHVYQKYKSIKSSDFVICISNNTKNDLLKYVPNLDERKIKVIYNGVNESFFPIDNFSPYRRKPFILFVGSRFGYKNFSSLVYSMKELKDFDLVCVGGGAITSSEKVLISRFIKDRFTHYPFVTNSELNYLYNGALCLVYPSLYEGFGIPPLEAMKAGCPVICLNNSSLPEVVGNSGILLEDLNSETLNYAINLLASYETRSDLILKGFNQASNFSWNKTFNELLKIYSLFT